MRREDRKPKESKNPKEFPLSLEQKKQKLREEIRKRFQDAFGFEDLAKIPNERKK